MGGEGLNQCKCGSHARAYLISIHAKQGLSESEPVSISHSSNSAGPAVVAPASFKPPLLTPRAGVGQKGMRVPQSAQSSYSTRAISLRSRFTVGLLCARLQHRHRVLLHRTTFSVSEMATITVHAHIPRIIDI